MQRFVFLCILFLELLPPVVLGKEVDVVWTRGGKGMRDSRGGKGDKDKNVELDEGGDTTPTARRRRRRRRRRRSNTTRRRRSRGGKSGSRPAPSPPPCGCPQQVCLMHGDPHFITFDGAMRTLVGAPQQNRYWAVKTPRVKIQGLATTPKAYYAGVAISGSFLQNHVLMAYYANKEIVVSWDGKRILKSDATIKPARGVELTRGKGLNEIKDSKTTQLILERLAKGTGQQLRQFSHHTVLHFKLPGNVEVITVLTATTGFIKMPPQRGQGGWCGNFNGKPADDGDPKKKSDPALAVAPRDDLFRKAGLGPPQLLQTESDSASLWWPFGTASNASGESTSASEGTQNANTRFHGCGSLEVLKKARSACSEFLQPQLLESCIMDVCETGETEAAVLAAEETSVLMALGRVGTSSIRQDGCVCD